MPTETVRGVRATMPIIDDWIEVDTPMGKFPIFKVKPTPKCPCCNSMLWDKIYCENCKTLII